MFFFSESYLLVLIIMITISRYILLACYELLLDGLYLVSPRTLTFLIGLISILAFNAISASGCLFTLLICLKISL